MMAMVKLQNISWWVVYVPRGIYNCKTKNCGQQNYFHPRAVCWKVHLIRPKLVISVISSAKKKAESEQMDSIIDLTAEERIRTSTLHLTLLLNTR